METDQKKERMIGMDYQQIGTAARIKDGIQNVLFRRRILSSFAAAALYLKSRGGKRMSPYFRSVLEQYVPQERYADRTYMKKLCRQLFFTHCCYAANYHEFFMYDFGELTEPERAEFLCWHELEGYYRKLNAMGRPEIFDDKAKAMETFRDFTGRDAVVIREASQREEFLSFVAAHPVSFLKPLKDFGGNGIRRLLSSATPESLTPYLEQCPFLVEEGIVQAPGMAQFCPTSVNTIRYNTFYHDGKLTRLQAVIRMGRSGSFVDNATAGGLYAPVDLQTGRILSPAKSDFGETYEVHPDTGLRFEGTQIPQWDELNDLVERIVRVVPEQKQVGWDFALSTGGWVMVEGNTFAGLQCFSQRRGMRRLITEAFGEAIPVVRR